MTTIRSTLGIPHTARALLCSQDEVTKEIEWSVSRGRYFSLSGGRGKVTLLIHLLLSVGVSLAYRALSRSQGFVARRLGFYGACCVVAQGTLERD